MINSDIGIFHFLILGILLFIIGFIGIIGTKNLIKQALSFGIIFNSICINFVAISKYCDGIKIEGNVFSVFVIGACLINLIIFICIIINIRKNHTTGEKPKG